MLSKHPGFRTFVGNIPMTLVFPLNTLMTLEGSNVVGIAIILVLPVTLKTWLEKPTGDNTKRVFVPMVVIVCLLAAIALVLTPILELNLLPSSLTTLVVFGAPNVILMVPSPALMSRLIM